MQTTYYIKGIHCPNCINKIEASFRSLHQVTAVSVDLSGKAVVESTTQLSEKDVAAAIQSAGHYTLSSPKDFSLFSKAKSYLPLILAFTSVVVWMIARRFVLGWNTDGAMHDFMGAFFLVFGALKIFSWKMFAQNFRGYDPLAARWAFYAYLYPLLEIYLGIGYQWRISGMYGNDTLYNVLTILILSCTTFGVIKVLNSSRQITCACLGGYFSIPITWFTVFENVLMILMAAFSLLLASSLF